VFFSYPVIDGEKEEGRMRRKKEREDQRSSILTSFSLVFQSLRTADGI